MQVKKFIYLPEGDVCDTLNYSGTPLYLGTALSELLESTNTQFCCVDTSEIINTEDIWRLAKQLISGMPLENAVNMLKQKQKGFLPNMTLLSSLQNCNSYAECLPHVKKYDDSVCQHVTNKILNIYESGDVILSLNPYNPLFGTQFPYALYVDTSLYEFYFLRNNGFLSYVADNLVLDYYRELEKKRLECASWIFSFSCACKHQLFDLYGIENAHVVYAGVNLSSSYNGDTKSKKHLQFLFVGRDFYEKGGHLVINAFLKLNKDQASLTIITNDRDSRILQYKYRNYSNIHILGIQTKQQMEEHYSNHHILVFPTQIDAFGLVCCEAMINKMFVIGSNYFAVPEILGKCGGNYTLNTHSVEELKYAMQNMYESYLQQIPKLEINYRRARYLFQWSTVAKKIVLIMCGNKL